MSPISLWVRSLVNPRMLAKPLIVFGLAAVYPWPAMAAATPPPNLNPRKLATADTLYQQRGDPAKAEQATEVLHEVLADDSNNYDAWWRLARLENFIGRNHESKDDDKNAARSFQAGIDAGRHAVALQPNRVEGHFWLGANYGLLAEEEGWIRGLRLVDTVRAQMETVIRLDPNYEEAAGQRTLARLYYRAPFFKGGDKQRSIQLLEDCLRRFPTDSFSLLYLGDDYLAVGRRDEAKQLYERVLGLSPDPEYGPELAENQSEARDRLRHEFRSGK